ncbi:DsbA family protein [Candidatus Gottesmanbacteria bacterium]|nr:DsbA family protein [Candidatus Gottesmanbacteria bacterium]
MAEAEKQNFLAGNPLQTILLIAVVVGSFFLGSLWTKVQVLEKGGLTSATKTAQPTPTTNTAPQAPPTAGADQIKDAFAKSLVKFGDANKKLVFIEVADPSCPYCHIAAGHNSELNKQVGDRFKLVADGGTYVAPVPEMKKLVDSGKAAFAWLYTPGHGNGEMGTKALFCAFEKGKFWEVHDKLMTNDGYNLLNNVVKNDKTKSQELVDFLASAYNPSDLKQCIDSGKYDNRLSEDISIASGLGVQGTPGFFVNTTRFAGAYSWKDMESAVKAAL